MASERSEAVLSDLLLKNLILEQNRQAQNLTLTQIATFSARSLSRVVRHPQWCFYAQRARFMREWDAGNTNLLLSVVAREMLKL